MDCVIVAAAAKSSAPCQQAVQICADRGRIVDVGAVELTFPWYEMYRKEIQLFMARAYGPGSYDPLYEKQGQDYPINYVRWTENRNMAEFLRLVSLGRIQLAPADHAPVSARRRAQGLRDDMDPASSSLAVLLNYPAASAPDVARRLQTGAEGAHSESVAASGRIGSGSGRRGQSCALGPFAQPEEDLQGAIFALSSRPTVRAEKAMRCVSAPTTAAPSTTRSCKDPKLTSS